MKKISATILSFVVLFTFVVNVKAATLTLTSIGSMDTTGVFYSHWWYTNTNPTLSGTADANAAVAVSIDGVTANTTANAAGLWSYSPTTLTSGDHTIIITSGAENVSFMLTIGATVPTDLGTTTTTTTATTPATLPDTGFGSMTIMLAVAGILALGFGAYNFAFAKEER